MNGAASAGYSEGTILRNLKPKALMISSAYSPNQFGGRWQRSNVRGLIQRTITFLCVAGSAAFCPGS